jgi:hypothetical protein
MAEETRHWEYRVQTIGSIFGTKDELVEAVLNEWGEEGWEAVNVYTPYGSGKITLVAKRPLTDRVRRLRSMPPMDRDSL